MAGSWPQSAPTPHPESAPRPPPRPTQPPLGQHPHTPRATCTRPPHTARPGCSTTGGRGGGGTGAPRGSNPEHPGPRPPHMNHCAKPFWTLPRMCVHLVPRIFWALSPLSAPRTPPAVARSGRGHREYRAHKGEKPSFPIYIGGTYPRPPPPPPPPPPSKTDPPRPGGPARGTPSPMRPGHPLGLRGGRGPSPADFVGNAPLRAPRAAGRLLLGARGGRRPSERVRGGGGRAPLGAMGRCCRGWLDFDSNSIVFRTHHPRPMPGGLGVCLSVRPSVCLSSPVGRGREGGGGDSRLVTYSAGCVCVHSMRASLVSGRVSCSVWSEGAASCCLRGRGCGGSSALLPPCVWASIVWCVCA